MPKVISVGEAIPDCRITQEETMEFARQLFSESFQDIERLLKVFHNGQIESRYFVKELDWFREDHTFAEKNDAFLEAAVKLGTESIENCLSSPHLGRAVEAEEIDAIFTICTSGLATPSLEARIMNILPFSKRTKRIPIWGLGCAGGASGLSRAYEYCRAFPEAKVLVMAVELCSLTFQKDDVSKSNLIGTSLFADGAACALIAGDSADRTLLQDKAYPSILGTQSALMEDSLDVMGWDIKDNGLYVVFSKSIPSLVEQWLKPNVEEFLEEHGLTGSEISHFIAHPGGKKVIQAYERALDLKPGLTDESLDVLRRHGNMSSATVLYVLRRFLEKEIRAGEFGLVAALGPGFSSELLLARWESC